MPRAKKESKLELFEKAYKRGDDSFLNRGSSAERRYMEGMGALIAIDIAAKSLNIKVPEVNLRALLALPGEIASSAIDAAGGGFSLPGLPKIPGLSGLGDVQRALVDPTFIGREFFERVTKPVFNKLTGVSTTATNNDGKINGEINSDIKVPVFSIMAIALTTGYLLEKGAGDQIAAIINAAGTVVEGASPELIRTVVN